MAGQQTGGFASSMREVIGFPFKAIPFVTLLGLVFAMASVPQFFKALSKRYVDDGSLLSSAADTALKWLARAAREISAWFASPAVANNLDTITAFALITVILLLPAALIRSVREKSMMPAALTASGFFAGLIALPVTIWLAILVWYLYRLGVWLLHFAQIVADWLAEVMQWLAPFLGVIIVGGALVGVALLIAKAGTVVRAIAASAVVGAAVAWFTDLLDPLVAWLGDLLKPVAAFLGMVLEWLVIGVAYVVTFLFYAFIVMAAVGLVLALFGTIGRISILSITGAWESGRGAQKVTDLSAGAGLTVGTVVLAGAMQRSPGDFGPWLENAWHATPLIGYIPAPVNLMDLLVPDMAQRYLVTYFTGFYPAIDMLLLVLVCLIGALSLALRTGLWDVDDGQRFRVAFPVLMAVGLVLVFTLPLVVMSLIGEGDGG